MKMKLNPVTRLERHVARWIAEEAREYDNHSIKSVFDNLFRGGCQSGIVGHLIYHTDCNRFFGRYKRDIIALLAEAIDEAGVNGPAGILSDWDPLDPFAEDDPNRCLLAWFGFEQAADILYFRMEEQNAAI